MSAYTCHPQVVPAPGPHLYSSWKALVPSVGRRCIIGLVGLTALVAACALAAAPAAHAAGTPVLVIVAHPDDEALGFSGAIETALTAGRPVYVAVVTNGATEGGLTDPICGVTDPAKAGVAARALQRDGETKAGMAFLGGAALPWTTNLAMTRVFFFGYPDGSLSTIEANGPVVDATGLNRTFADDGGSACNGDYHFLKTGTHATFTSANLATDIDNLLSAVKPADIYTHVTFDGHADHATVARQVAAAVRRSPTLNAAIHGTLIHETGNGTCQAATAAWWPNPEGVADPVLRSTPGAGGLFAAPPLFATDNATGYPSCPPLDDPSAVPVGHDWGPLGPPTELATVPSDMQAADLNVNKKWQTIVQYDSQVGCPSAASCGYVHGFVKNDEIFWKQQVSLFSAPVPIDWPRLAMPAGPSVGSLLSVSWPTTAAAAFQGTPTSFTYQWLRCNADDRYTCTSLGAPTSSPTVYTAVAGDIGMTLRVKVIATNAYASSLAVYSGSTDPIRTAPVNTVLPTITGTATAGQTLTSSTGMWTGVPAPTFTYEWQRSATGTSSWVAIAGATGLIYVVASSDGGFYLRVQVTGTNSEGAVASVAVSLAPAGGCSLLGYMISASDWLMNHAR